jgi:hypothetical protein
MKKVRDTSVPQKEKESYLQKCLDIYSAAITEIQNTMNGERRLAELFFKRGNVFMRMGQNQTA